MYVHRVRVETTAVGKQQMFIYDRICIIKLSISQIAKLFVLPFGWEGLRIWAAAATGGNAGASGVPCCEL